MTKQSFTSRTAVGKKDWLVISAILLSAVICASFFLFSPAQSESKAFLYLEDEMICEIDLNEDLVFSLPDYPNITFEVKNGAVRFLHSDCPDQTCVHTGFIRSGGQYAVCLPYKLSLRIESESAPDAVTGFAKDPEVKS